LLNKESKLESKVSKSGKNTALHFYAGENVQQSKKKKGKDSSCCCNGNDRFSDGSKLIKSGKNTALHFAAGNVNVTNEFIDELKVTDATIQNAKGDTPFHVAAKSSNPNAIIYMLKTFAPSKGGWDIDDVERSGNDDTEQDKQDKSSVKLEDNTLLNICATRGNAEAVALLIQHGADLSKNVLCNIIKQSAKYPEKTDQLLAVYRTIVDNVVTWRCLEENTKLKTKDSHGYYEFLRETMMWLITRPDKPEYNAIRCAIQNGDSEFLQEILNTKDVFRVDLDKKDMALFDVTNFTAATKGDQKSLPCHPARTDTQSGIPYMVELVNNSVIWRETKIFEKQPIKGLTEPYILLSKIIYGIAAVLQLIYMICFSYYYIPTTCSLIDLFNLNASAPSCESTAENRSDTKNIQSNPSSLWLIWPVITHVVNGFTVLASIVVVIVYWLIALLKYVPLCRRTFKDYELKLKLENFITSGFEMIVSNLFCLVVFIWYFYYCSRTRLDFYKPHKSYLEATSMVLLFGWFFNFFLFSGMSLKLCVFSQVLREIIIKDIALNFLLVFVFTFVAFSFAMHVLRLSELPSDDTMYLRVTVYDVFAAALGAGAYFQNAREGRRGFGIPFDLFEGVMITYICVTAIILLNVLIAMVNLRYKKAKLRAENNWRFSKLSHALLFESCPLYRSLIKWQLRHYSNNLLKVRLH